MKLINSFKEFVDGEVTLNKDRQDRIKTGIQVVRDFLEGNELFGDNFKKVTPQGSVRQGTTTKPVDDNDFDVDLLYELKVYDGWEPKDYLENLHNEFKKTDRYKDIVDKRGKSRCVTLDYESDFHIDIVPCIEADQLFYVMNRPDNVYEITDADGYAIWFESCCRTAGDSYLTDCVKLIKYVKDRKKLPMKSVLLTTIMGNQIIYGDSGIFVDLPTAFKILVGRIDDFLQAYSEPPIVANPALSAEKFDRHWDHDKFIESKNKIQDIRKKVDEAYTCDDLDESLTKWRKVFGDDFSLSDKDTGKAVSPKTTFALGSYTHRQPVTAIPGCRGEALNNSIGVRMDGYLYSHDGRTKFRGINSNVRIGNNLRLKYIAKTNAREPYEVYWQVVNTGQHAEREKCLRGEFSKGRLPKGGLSSDKHVNWERSEYTGRHWIECFVIQNGYCVARSGPFYVNIKNPNF